MLRLFLAVDLSPEARQSLADALSWMSEYESQVKIVPPKNYHVTLKFLGATDEERIPLIRTAIEAAAKKNRACELKLNGWGVFPEKGHPKVFWVGVEPTEALGAVFQQCETALEALGYPRETRGFQSHATLARTGQSHAPAGFLERWRSISLIPGPVNFNAGQITLYESVTGGRSPIYRPLAFFKLE